MPRKARTDYKTNFFHIMVQGINKSYIFKRAKDKKVYIKMINETSQTCDLQILAYCVMDNHTHFLIKADKIDVLSKYMKIINLKYSIYYNKSHNRVGYVFRDRFKSQGIYSERQLYTCARYIINNPVKAKMCIKPSEYDFSYCLLGLINLTQYEDCDENDVGEEDFIDIVEESVDYMDLAKEFVDKNNLKIYDSDYDKECLIKYLRRQKVSIAKISEATGISVYKVKKIVHLMQNCQ